MVSEQKYAIRFGLGAIKAVGFNMIETVILERNKNGKFKDLYDFSKRVDPKMINKKSIEALSKSGSFDNINKNRRQISESFDVLSSFANEAMQEASSNQMSLFGAIADSDMKPPLKKVENWPKSEKLQHEFEAFGFFLNEHPIDDNVVNLKKRGVIFSTKIEADEIEDNSIVRMAGVVASSKHRSGSKGRFAYLNISDPYGIFEATIFDEALITNNRDLLQDGCEIVIECLVRKDEGGTRILVRDVKKLNDFINNNQPAEQEYEYLKTQPNRPKFKKPDNSSKNIETKLPSPVNKNFDTKEINPKKINEIEILITSKDVILPLKTILMQKINESENEGTKIFLVTSNDTKILLQHSYKISEIDILRLKNLNSKNLSIKSINTKI